MHDEIPEIKDNSVDLILTDPPYLKEKLGLFDDLARFAIRKLKTGGALLFIYGRYQEPEVHEIFARYRDQLSYLWTFSIYHTGGQSIRIHTRGVWVDHKPMLAFVKGKLSDKLAVDDVHDFIESEKPDKEKHPWAQSPKEALYFISRFTVGPDSIVVDPFLGSGAFAQAAIELGRYFIRVEINKDTFDLAKANLLMDEVQKKKQQQPDRQNSHSFSNMHNNLKVA
jgi:DNA modification methylase